ncbi:hypothetical protein PIIN_08106 [Serendipita indica DSM 11827]|uniref:F-box domain-containing protein n=1 Tax=Serendipita indica (strain DSM 11827) TaxID=1109443 RepID=G4TS60_SERID|nr:hypothetical protein PIIN_08106 [Serendipita indica DSM 11827]
MPVNDRPRRKAARKSREKTSNLFAKARFRRPKPNAVNVLPEELFVYIFQDVCGLEGAIVVDPFASAFVLASVCRLWRHIALRVPKIWIYIHLRLGWDKERLTEFWTTLRPRAGLVPIVLVVHDDDRRVEDREMVECISEWMKDETLSIHLVSILVSKAAVKPLPLPLYLSAFTRPVDAVRIHTLPKKGRFQFEDIWGLPTLREIQSTVDLIEMINNLPPTQEFTVEGLRLAAEVELGPHTPLESLEVFSIRCTIDNNGPFALLFERPVELPLRSILARCKKLHSLELDGYISPHAEEVEARLDSLEILQLSDFDLVPDITGLNYSVNFPSLKNLSIQNPGDWDTLRIFLEANPSITCLTAPWFSDMSFICRGLPGLEEWEVEDPEHLEMLYTGEDDGRTWKVPHLRSLSLSFIDVPVQLEDLKQLIHTRMWRRNIPESVATLQMLTVQVARPPNSLINIEALFKTDIQEFAVVNMDHPTFIEFFWSSNDRPALNSWES